MVRQIEKELRVVYEASESSQRIAALEGTSDCSPLRAWCSDGKVSEWPILPEVTLDVCHEFGSQARRYGHDLPTFLSKTTANCSASAVSM